MYRASWKNSVIFVFILSVEICVDLSRLLLFVPFYFFGLENVFLKVSFSKKHFFLIQKKGVKISWHSFHNLLSPTSFYAHCVKNAVSWSGNPIRHVTCSDTSRSGVWFAGCREIPGPRIMGFPNGRVSRVAGFKSRVAALKSRVFQKSRVFKSRGFFRSRGFSKYCIFSQWYSFKQKLNLKP